MRVDENLRDLERQQKIPITSFPWQNPDDPREWAPEVAELGEYLKNKARGGSSILFLPSHGFSTSSGTSELWRTAKLALDVVVALSPPCEGHILRARVLDVLERAKPGEDKFHVQVMDCFNEAAHTVWMKERVG